MSFHHYYDTNLVHTNWVRDPLDSFIFPARFFALNYDPYVDFGSVLRAGISAEFEEALMDDLSENGDGS